MCRDQPHEARQAQPPNCHCPQNSPSHDCAEATFGWQPIEGCRRCIAADIHGSSSSLTHHDPITSLTRQTVVLVATCAVATTSRDMILAAFEASVRRLRVWRASTTTAYLQPNTIPYTLATCSWMIPLSTYFGCTATSKQARHNDLQSDVLINRTPADR